MTRGARWAASAVVLLAAAAGAEPRVLEGTVPVEGPDFIEVSFDLPADVAELEIAHDDLSEENVLDFGLRDPAGFRGWGGGNPEPIVVGLHAASRSYLPGPLPTGTWSVVIGRAQVLDPPARYRLELTFRDTPVLAAQPERRAYAPAAALNPERRWYAGDFHVHSRESGDARPTLDEIATFARARRLDFVELSEHNTDSHVGLLSDAQARHPALLLVPGVEFTTYAGHANGIGVTRYVDHRLGVGGVDLASAAEAIRAQGAVFSINHPALELGELCIGCAWRHELDPALVGAVEIGTGGWAESGFAFGLQALAFWDDLCDQGARPAPIGGSDDHRAGQGLGAFHSPIGSPTTMVFADRLDSEGIVEAVRRGRTVVQLQGPEDPFVELTAGEAMVGDEVVAETVTLSARVVRGGGHSMRWVKNGEPGEAVEIDSDPFVSELVVEPAMGIDRWRVEVVVDGSPRTVTNHLWIRAPEAAGCGCGAAGAGGVAMAGMVRLARRRRVRDAGRRA